MDKALLNLVPFPADDLICSDAADLHRIQQLVISQLQASCFLDRDIFGIRLALEEALVNAIKHGNRSDRSKSVRVSFCIHENTFFVRICDQGAGFNPADVPDPTQKEYLERPCGRGLMLMRHYMNEVCFLDQGATVVMWKRSHAR